MIEWQKIKFNSLGSLLDQRNRNDDPFAQEDDDEQQDGQDNRQRH